MSDRDAFLAAIFSNPADTAPRLVFADWLDEHDEPFRAAVLRRGTLEDLIELYAGVVITDPEGLTEIGGRRYVGPWQWSGRADARPSWLPAVAVRAPFVLTCVAATGPTVEVWVRTESAECEKWQAFAPHSSFTSPVPPLPGEWALVLTRGTGSIELILTIEDQRSERIAHFYPERRERMR